MKIHSLVFVLFVASCKSNVKIDLVNKGMTVKDVHKVLAIAPISTEKAYWNDSLFIENYESDFGASDHHKVIYSISDSTVTRVVYGN